MKNHGVKLLWFCNFQTLLKENFVELCSWTGLSHQKLLLTLNYLAFINPWKEQNLIPHKYFWFYSPCSSMSCLCKKNFTRLCLSDLETFFDKESLRSEDSEAFLFPFWSAVDRDNLLVSCVPVSACDLVLFVGIADKEWRLLLSSFCSRCFGKASCEESDNLIFLIKTKTIMQY